jgi:hypothetical protein
MVLSQLAIYIKLTSKIKISKAITLIAMTFTLLIGQIPQGAYAAGDIERIEVTGARPEAPPTPDHGNAALIANMANNILARGKILAYLLSLNKDIIADIGRSDGSNDCGVGNPVLPSTGAKVESETDIVSIGQYPLTLSRHYSSKSGIGSRSFIGHS